MSWSSVKLGDTCDVIAGGTPKRSEPSYWGGDIPWVKISDMLEGRISQTEETITRAGLRGSSAKLLPPGTLLVSIFATIGRTAVLDCEAATNQAIVGVIPRQHGQFDERFLQYSLRRKTQELRRQGRGVAQANINGSLLKATELPLPPLAEQKRIAGILDAADALRAKRHEALAQLDTLMQSTFFDMFGDPVTNPKGLEVELLGELIAMGPQNGLYKPERNYGSGVRILRIDGFYDGAVNDLSTLKRVGVSEQEIQKYGLSESDIVINRVNSRSHLGKSALIPDLGGEPVVFESNMMRLAVDSARVSPFFMIHFLQTSFIRNQILRSAKDSINQASINQGDVRGLRILVPSGDSQRRFVSIAESIEQQKASQRAHLAELDTLFASLQSRAFRGDL